MSCDNKRAHCCDDQLPVIASMGRGPRGDSSVVRLGEPDTCTETYVEGWTMDEQGNIVANSAWRTENINGGELSHYYTLRPFTRPRTFTMTFVYRRPGRCEWSWTTPAIPYIWSIDDNGVVDDAEHVVGSGVATMFIRGGKDKPWIEKLVYPEGTTREDFNAPGPEEAWTANITLGVGGDVDVPNLDDIAKIVGISPDDIRDIIERHPGTFPEFTDRDLRTYIDRRDRENLDHVHTDLGFGDNLTADGGSLSVKSYIDSMVDNVSVVSTNPDMLAVETVRKPHAIGSSNFGYGIEHKLKPARIMAGPGIQIDKTNNGDIIVTNTSVGGNFKSLTPGTDFTWKWHNGWYGGEEQSNTGPLASKPSGNTMPPNVGIIVSRNADGDIIGAEVRIGKPSGGYFVNEDNLIAKNSDGELSKFMFKHSESLEERPLSAIVSISFAGEYSVLNDMRIFNQSEGDTGVWNVKGTNAGIHDNDPGWVNCGACWSTYCRMFKTDEAGYKKFVMTASGLSDGYNSQYTAPKYGYDALCIVPWANILVNMVLK